ncbi:endonuclease/exonuclease/phosphatase family protein [Actinorugispora endophytica]|uniref:Endonuclease/exonuclease/phosphatase (EEP) superfamily protein YafD n=1 Tax=Actinorugispora endophytica TaxID=1605990 RepID=A0A4R6UW12_9ACTN|nr:endonuclease/exonuclease/phosphatase family protein [Actinorugispora endophytica]TDQ51431.1 endonuclease/exonuclease/phosphatase (EEP) superfamily protein YafD [Actinorugispora endophytica]
MEQTVRTGPAAGAAAPARRSRRPWPTVVAALLLLPWALWALVRGFGLESGYPLTAGVTFTPYAAATAVLPLLFALLARRWLPALAAALVAAVLVGLLLPRALADAPPDPAPTGPALRVLTLNMYLGSADAETVVDLVRRNDVDLLSLQELTPDAADALETAGIGGTLPHAVVEARLGASGGGLYSRHPLTRIAGPTDHEPEMPWAEVAVPGAVPVEAVSAHPFPPLGPGMTRDWTRYMADLPHADPDGAVRVLAGDLNATTDHAVLRELLATGYTDAAAAAGNGFDATWPVGGTVPGVVIDHVLADERARAVRTSTHLVPGTDHRALLAEVVLPAA